MEGNAWDAIGLSSGSVTPQEAIGLFLCLAASVVWMWMSGEGE